MTFNINDNVFVQLTDLGRKAHRYFHTNVVPQLPYQAPAEDAEGWSEFTLWHLMEIFGPHLANGRPLMFQTTIRLGAK